MLVIGLGVAIAGFAANLALRLHIDIAGAFAFSSDGSESFWEEFVVEKDAPSVKMES
jgi:hypothetical protein